MGEVFVSKIANAPGQTPTGAFISSIFATIALIAAGSVTHAGTLVNVEQTAFRILSLDGQKLLGHARYGVEYRENGAVLVGENRYADGEYDVERDVIKVGSQGAAPALVSFEHSFFNRDGSRKLVSRADLSTGQAACTSYEMSGQERTLDKEIDFPSDTYAGATSVLPLEHALRTGSGRAEFHVFDCAPGPAVVAVAAELPHERRNWNLYPGGLVQVDVTADLGWLGALVDGLLPHRHAWFDPASGWHYVGGKIQRYFGNGPEVLLVREAAVKVVPQG